VKNVRKLVQYKNASKIFSLENFLTFLEPLFDILRLFWYIFWHSYTSPKNLQTFKPTSRIFKQFSELFTYNLPNNGLLSNSTVASLETLTVRRSFKKDFVNFLRVESKTQVNGCSWLSNYRFRNPLLWKQNLALFDPDTCSLISFSHNIIHTRWSTVNEYSNSTLSLSVFLVESDEKGDNFSVILK